MGDPKPKPRKGQTQEENETEFEQQLELKGFDVSSVDTSGITYESPYDSAVTVTPATNFTTSTSEPTYLDFHDEPVVVTFSRSEEQHKELRNRYPALEKAYDHYKTLLALAQNGPEDLDN